jgi:hypothetical protein
MDNIEAQRAIATLHSFRFFGLVFILPGVVGYLPATFATVAAYGDFATGLLAMLALLTVKMRPLFWLFVVAFNLVGVADLIIDYYNATQLGLPALAGELGSTYVIPIIYVPLLMITHVVALYLLVRSQPTVQRVIAGNAVAP